MTRDGWLALALIVPVGAAVLQAQQWGSRAALFPTVIGLSLLVLLALQVAAAVRQARFQSATRAAVHAQAAPMNPAERHRVLLIAAWLVALAVLVWALGFPLGGTLGTLLYLLFTAREGWRIVLSVTLGTALFFHATAVWLGVPYPAGALQKFIGLG